MIDRGRMNASIRVFEDKMQPGSDGNVTEQELVQLKAPDFQSILNDALAMADDAITA
jgi:hypothetical protein